MTRYSLGLFDVDSTLVTIEGIDALAGNDQRIARLTEAAMNGELSIEQVYARRLDLLKPTRRQIENLARTYIASLTPGVQPVIRELQNRGIDIHLVTAGIEQAVRPLAEHLGIGGRAVHSVPLFFDSKGRYQGFERRSPLTRARGKETVALDVRARTHGRTFFVGDGVTDLDAKEAVDLFVGFGGVKQRERVRRESHIFIHRFEELLPIVFEESSNLKRLTRRRES